MDEFIPIPAATSLNTDSSERVSRYGALPEPIRHGTALCLSGGGYRAALFHLGGLERLNELGVLSHVSTISSVSGGSIVSAQIATALADGDITWPEAGRPIDGWTESVTARVRAFTKRNIRTPAIFNRLRPANWFHDHAGGDGLAAQYLKYLTALPLQGLPGTPRFIISATDMVFGVNWTFDSQPARAGDHQAGYTSGLPADTPLARAVAASSCFPPVFNPIPTGLGSDELAGGLYVGADRSDLVDSIRLSDGGVYDNMGLEPVWDTHRWVLVSDGGAPFSAQKPFGLFQRLARYHAITGNQALAMRKRWLIHNFESGGLLGTYWGTTSSPHSYPPEGTHPGYGEDLASAIARIRTDLDRFSRLEADTLITHGYFLANVAAGVYLADLIGHPSPPSRPAPDPDSPRLAQRLEAGSRQRILGRGFLRSGRW